MGKEGIFKNIKLISALQFFPTWHFHRTSAVIYTLFLVRILRCPLWREFEMRFGLEHWRENLGLSSQMWFILYFWYGFWGAHCGEDLKCGLGLNTGGKIWVCLHSCDLYFIFGTHFEVPTVARIWNAVWVGTLEGKSGSVFTAVIYTLFLVRIFRCPLWRGFEMRFGFEHWRENLGLSSQRARMKVVCSDGKPLYPCVTLYGPMIQKIKS